MQYLIFDYVNKGDICAMMLLEDLIGNVSKYFTLDTQTIEKESHCSCKTYRTPLTNCIACIKNVLHHNETEYANAKSIIAPTKTTGISYSNSLDFKVQQLQNNISITYNLPIDSKVTLEVLDLSGKTIAVSIRENELDAGMHTHILNIKPFGLFLVKLTVNGCVNIKKYTLKQ